MGLSALPFRLAPAMTLLSLLELLWRHKSVHVVCYNLIKSTNLYTYTTAGSGHGGQFHFVNSNSTQFHLVNSTSDLSIPIPNLSIPIPFLPIPITDYSRYLE